MEKTLLLLLAIVGGLEIINIVLGTILGTCTIKFDFKKFLFGILKAIVIAICIVGTCYLCELFAFTLNSIEGIEIKTEIVNAIEIVCVVVAWCVDLFKEVLEKIKSLKDLKYISYDDVITTGGNVDEH